MSTALRACSAPAAGRAPVAAVVRTPSSLMVSDPNILTVQSLWIFVVDITENHSAASAALARSSSAHRGGPRVRRGVTGGSSGSTQATDCCGAGTTPKRYVPRRRDDAVVLDGARAARLQ